MKSTTTLADQERLSPAQKIAWLVTIDDGAQFWHASNRTLTVGGDNFEPMLVGLPAWNLAPISSGNMAGGFVASNAEVRLIDGFASGPSLAERLATRDPFDFRFKLKVLWMDADNTWASSDAVQLISGRIDAWSFQEGLLALRAADSISAKARKRVGRRLSEAMLGGAPSPLVGANLPIVFGIHDALILRELFPGTVTSLTEPLGSTDGVVEVESLDGFERSGTAQIGTEQITYSDISTANQTLGTISNPVTRAASALRHTKREPVRFVPPGGFKWVVADHDCESVTNLRANGETLDVGDWTAQLEALGTISAQIVHMNAWPTVLRYSNAPREESAKTLSGVGSGIYAVASGNTALTPELAVDSSSSSSAIIKTANPKLSFEVGNDLATEGILAGLWKSPVLRVRYSSNIDWNAGSTVKVRLDQNGTITEATLPVGNPSTTIQEFELDLAGAIDAATAWNGFGVTPLVKTEVEFTPSGTDNAQISIHDLDIRVTYFPGIPAQMAGPLTANVQGWNDGGVVKTNPIDVLKVLLTDSRFGENSSSGFGALTFATPNFDLSLEGYAFAKIVDDGPSLIELVDAAAREAGLWVWAGTSAVGVRRTKIWPRLLAATALDASVRLSRDSEAEPKVETERRLGPCLELLAPESLETTDEVSILICRNSGGATEAIPTRVTLDWLDGRDPRPMDVVARLMRHERLSTRLAHEGPFPLGLVILEPGDEVLVTDAITGVTVSAPMWIRSLALTAKGQLTIEADGLRPGARPFASGETTFLRVFDTGDFLAMYIAGEPVGMLERLGDFEFAGVIAEVTTIGAGPFSEAITYSGGAIYFGITNGSTFDAFLELDASGNVNMLGDLVEASDLAFATPGEIIDEDSAGFRISPHPERADFEYVDATPAFHLRGDLTEEQSF